MLNIGKMDKRVALERFKETITMSGAPVAEWETMAVVWAELIKQSADEFLAGFGEAENETAIFRIRYHPGLTTADRVTYEGTEYNLKEITPLGRREALELRCEVTQ